VALLRQALGIRVAPVWCTKIASKLVRTYTDRHGLKDLTRELLGVEMSKQQQSSDWGAPTLSDAQVEYAASDVLHLHALKSALEARLLREGRMALAESCFAFLPVRAELDLLGWGEEDIFAHS
jgi:ribonuclease D